ncbi:MAG TPA: sulfate adenylyltransferase subunit CysN [Thermoanaerobaculia bacterium]
MAAEAFLSEYRDRELLRFLTCGSVDDGKSTLIGRLLHDAGTVYEDHMRAAHRGNDLDLALLVDGLQAEREQGITIDVAYRYFSTPKRKFVIADTPGHEQYTRNMATGASNSDLAVLLVDATQGVLDQTRRHAFIASLLGIRHLVVAVNKMDLVGWSEAVFRVIRDEFSEFAARLQVSDIEFIPMSALLGDNVVHGSDQMPWHAGGPLLAHLESVHIASDRNLIDFRMPVQLVVRPNAEFRGYAGSIASGVLRADSEVLVLPSRQQTRVRSILTANGESDRAFAPMPVTVTLEDEVDVSRGDMLVYPNNVPHLEHAFEAMVVWMHEDGLAPGREYLLKQTANVVPATVSTPRYRINVNTLSRESCESLALNEIGRVRVETPRLLAFDAYERNRTTGAFILIDRLSYATVAAGMIVDRDSARPETSPALVPDWSRRLGQLPLSIAIRGTDALGVAGALRELLSRRGFLVEMLTRDAIGNLDPVALSAYLRRFAAITIIPMDAPGPLVVTCDEQTIAGRDAEAIYATLTDLELLVRL